MTTAKITPAPQLARLRLDKSARVLVVGLGSTGLSVARFLASQGIQLAVTDTREKPPGLAELHECLPDAAVFLGGFDERAFERASHLVVSPGVSLDEPLVKKAMQSGIPAFGDLDLFVCMAQAPIVGITGSNGKSTVTTLLGLMAESDRRKVMVGGNLGTPMLDLLDAQAELYVLELSSFQLERASLLEAAAATVLNISQDHLDRYPSLSAYAESKSRIFAGSGVMVLNADDPVVMGMARADRRTVRFSVKAGVEAEYRLEVQGKEAWLFSQGRPVMPASSLRIKGRHNIANALAAMALGEAVGLSEPAMVKAMREFPGLHHRMQWVASVDGVTYINDSKATNVGACVAALEGLSETVVLIAGGDGKGADFSELAPAVADKARAVVLMGRDAPLLEQALASVVPTVRAENMAKAVAAARQLSVPGDVVLLAPACASLDQYQDYRERGRIFTEIVKGLLS